jgi:hypothetical protein
MAHELMVKALGQKETYSCKSIGIKNHRTRWSGYCWGAWLLMEHYQVDSVGWGSPFLLVPEATSLMKKHVNY